MSAIHYTPESLQQAHVRLANWAPHALHGPRVIPMAKDAHAVAEQLGALTADANFLEDALRRKGGAWDEAAVPLPTTHATP